MHFVSVQVLVDDYKRGLGNVFQDTSVRSFRNTYTFKDKFRKAYVAKVLTQKFNNFTLFLATDSLNTILIQFNLNTILIQLNSLMSG